MRFLTIYVILFLIPSLYGEDDMCKIAFEEEGLDDAFNCNTTSLINLTKQSDKGALRIIDGTDSHSEIDGGEVFYLNCCFYSNPYCPIITWYKDGIPVEIKDGSIIRKANHGRTLQIHATPDAAGNYTCNATTPYGEVKTYTIRDVNVITRCSGKFTVVTAPSQHVIRRKKGSSQKLVWNFICFGALHSSTVRCKRNNSEEIIGRDGYYNIKRIRSAKNNEVALQHIITISNFSRSENITCKINANGSPSATFILLLEEETDSRQLQTNNVGSFFEEKGVWILVGGTLLLISFVACLFLLSYRKKLGRKTVTFYRPMKKDVAARYDAFISYSEVDGGQFVRSTLKPMLEDECGYKLSLHYREFVPGIAIVDNIVDSIYDSRRIVTIVTPKFLESEWCKFEVDQSLRRAIEKPNTLVVIMLNEMSLNQLPKSLRSFVSDVTFLQWDDGKRDEMCKKMKSALGAPFTVNDIYEQGENKTDVEIAFE